MIKLSGITFRYAGAAHESESLKDINLTVNAGECILLTGKSGCGKTTLTRVLNGLCPKFYEGELSGEYLLAGNDTNELPVNEIGRTVGSVFQDPRSQFFCTNTTDEIVFSMESHAYSQADMTRRLESLWEILPIQHLLERRIFNLSSGEKQKIAIASVCAAEPKVLILDEPSANLDADATEQLAALLERLKRRGHTIIISEHRIHYLMNIVDRMLVLDNGRIYREYTKEEAVGLAENELLQLGLRKLIQPRFIPLAPAKPGIMPAAISEKIYLQKGNSQILQGLDMRVFAGEITAITGSNGAGKTTICKVLTGVEKENSGTVCYGGTILKPKERIRNSYLVQQDTDYQLYAATVMQELLIGLKETPDIRKQACMYLEKLNLTEFRDRHPASLSGGQKQRVLIAAALLRNRQLIVLDEPTSGLDGMHMRLTAELLSSMAADGKTIILITHDMELIDSCVTRIYHVGEGKIANEYRIH